MKIINMYELTQFLAYLNTLGTVLVICFTIVCLAILSFLLKLLHLIFKS